MIPLSGAHAHLVGTVEGIMEGPAVGTCEGRFVGPLVGCREGATVGVVVGPLLTTR
jgi:hypothetical protein